MLAMDCRAELHGTRGVGRTRRRRLLEGRSRRGAAARGPDPENVRLQTTFAMSAGCGKAPKRGL